MEQKSSFFTLPPSPQSQAHHSWLEISPTFPSSKVLQPSTTCGVIPVTPVFGFHFKPRSNLNAPSPHSKVEVQMIVRAQQLSLKRSNQIFWNHITCSSSQSVAMFKSSSCATFLPPGPPRGKLEVSLGGQLELLPPEITNQNSLSLLSVK